MRSVFMGTPEIAVPALEALARTTEIVAVICQPDRPAGRGLAPKTPAVKERALALGLSVVQPAKIRTPEFVDYFRGLHADVAVVLAYGRILPPDVLAAPAQGCLNLHASILPKYRGAAPIQWAIAHGEVETGVSLMQMDEGLDTGPVYCVRTLAIGENETAGELAPRIAGLAAEVITSDLPRALRSELRATPQVDREATLAPVLKKEDGRIDWTRAAKQVHDHVRAMTPWPSAHTQIEGKLLKILSTRVSSWSSPGAEPGVVLSADSNGVLVACGSGTLEIGRAQVEGRKPADGRDLVNGRVLARGTKLQ